MADKAFMSFTQNGEQLGLGHSLLVGGDTMEYRALVSDVAKKIIEDYAGSTLAGSAQSVQAALASLNSNMNGEDFTSQVTASDGETWANVKFVKVGKACFVSYQGAAKAHAANAVLCVLPTGYRPAVATYAPFVKNANAYGVVAIMPNGNIYINQLSSTSASGRIYFNAVYFLP